jgi:hypothetical protein
MVNLFEAVLVDRCVSRGRGGGAAASPAGSPCPFSINGKTAELSVDTVLVLACHRAGVSLLVLQCASVVDWSGGTGQQAGPEPAPSA